MRFHPPVPILRSFDERKAREFYVEWLGFTVTFEYRQSPDAPLYMGVARGECELHLSEHHGDGTPGTAIRVRTDDLEAYFAELQSRPYRHYQPCLQDQTWGCRELTVQDGAGNKLTFFRDL
jgi:uncharacterized glyoxalase superfamily protein PhnB